MYYIALILNMMLLKSITLNHITIHNTYETIIPPIVSIKHHPMPIRITNIM
jgi:hypothetical protein